MIASLRGVVSHVNSDSLVVELGGVGVKVFTPAPVKDGVRAGETVYLHTHLVVRQDVLALYGFETVEMREFFELLLSVDGIGPKSALSILSVMTPEAIRRAVFQEQAEVFTRAPGIGKKTAQKILLYLQDKVKAEGLLEKMTLVSDVDTEVLAALTALGYSVVEAQAALQAIPREAPQELEARLRLALQYFITPARS
jgi:Holliday junction DNA helicase RuvA